jgi:phosphatidylinositol-3-phosphatase
VIHTHRHWLRRAAVAAFAGISAVYCLARPALAASIGDVFVIAMENHNFTQPASYTSTQAIYGNANAPYFNSLITPNNANAAQTAWASNYTSVGASVHPSEPNYIWNEAGTNFGVTSDNNPFGSGGTEQTTNQHLTGLLQQAGISWKSYQEDIDLSTSTGAVLPQSQWTVPLGSFSGSFSNGATPNPYNSSLQYNYAPKHNPAVFFTDTSGGNNTTNSNTEVSHYAPLQQLQTDLSNNTVSHFNWVTPDMYNDMHTALTGGFTYHGNHLTGDSAQIAQGDNFLSTVVPEIEASQAYQNNGLILIWFDETEGGDNANYTIPFIAISPLAKGNAYQSTVNITHSSDVRTMQEIFQVAGTSTTGYLGAAATASDESDLFQSNVLSGLQTFLPGDFNRDGHVNAADILPMELALTNFSAYKATYAPSITDAQLELIEDVNSDSSFNNADLQYLLNKLQSGGGSADAVPEPSSCFLVICAVVCCYSSCAKHYSVLCLAHVFSTSRLARRPPKPNTILQVNN